MPKQTYNDPPADETNYLHQKPYLTAELTVQLLFPVEPFDPSQPGPPKLEHHNAQIFLTIYRTPLDLKHAADPDRGIPIGYLYSAEAHIHAGVEYNSLPETDEIPTWAKTIRERVETAWWPLQPELDPDTPILGRHLCITYAQQACFDNLSIPDLPNPSTTQPA